MTPDQAAAYVHANSVAATAEIEAMKAANKEREMRNMPLAYTDAEFLSLIDKYDLHHNAVISLFRSAGE